MMKKILARYKERTRQARFKQYVLQLSLIGAELYKPKTTPLLLAEFWRQINVADFTAFTASQRMETTLTLGHQNLLELVGFIEQFNQLMSEEHDGLIAQICNNHFVEQRNVVLDHYLADDKQYAVNNLTEVFTRLRGELLSHVHLLEGFNNQFYQRQAQRFYLEVYQVSKQLVQLITQETITPIKVN